MFCLPAKKASSPGVSERQNKNGILKRPAALEAAKGFGWIYGVCGRAGPTNSGSSINDILGVSVRLTAELFPSI